MKTLEEIIEKEKQLLRDHAHINDFYQRGVPMGKLHAFFEEALQRAVEAVLEAVRPELSEAERINTPEFQLVAMQLVLKQFDQNRKEFME